MAARSAYPWPPPASPPPLLATLDDLTPFEPEAEVPELRDPATGRISETAAELRIAAAEAGAVVDSLPGMLPFHLPSRSSGSLFGGLFGSRYIPHGADPSGLCCGSAEHYRYLVLGLRITERYNALAPTPGARGTDVELGSSLLWLLWSIRSVPRRIRSDLAAEGLVWAGPAFADYICYLWDDLYADLHCHGAPVAELATPERIQRAAAAVVSLRAVAPPFAAGLVDNATPRFAAVLLSALRASNAAAGSAVPPRARRRLRLRLRLCRDRGDRGRAPRPPRRRARDAVRRRVRPARLVRPGGGAGARRRRGVGCHAGARDPRRGGGNRRTGRRRCGRGRPCRRRAAAARHRGSGPHRPPPSQPRHRVAPVDAPPGGRRRRRDAVAVAEVGIRGRRGAEGGPKGGRRGGEGGRRGPKGGRGGEPNGSPRRTGIRNS